MERLALITLDMHVNVRSAMRWIVLLSAVVLYHSHLSLVKLMNDKCKRFEMTIDWQLGNKMTAHIAVCTHSLSLMIDDNGWQQKN